ncbi:hypothetical protein HAX54_049329, partial [Datura stramonium]|nr:hypothetical protein [Datura stramonium]
GNPVVFGRSSCNGKGKRETGWCDGVLEERRGWCLAVHRLRDWWCSGEGSEVAMVGDCGYAALSRRRREEKEEVRRGDSLLVGERDEKRGRWLHGVSPGLKWRGRGDFPAKQWLDLVQRRLGRRLPVVMEG